MTDEPQPPDESADEPADGASFGKYRLIRRIGQGSFGSVYEAVLPGAMGFTKRVAIKRLRPHLGGPESTFARAMVNEARLGGLLHHANIVDVLEFDSVGSHQYLAMEYVDGVTLTEVIRLCQNRRILLPRFAVVDIALQICRGLQFAHELQGEDGRPLGVIHRDLKPSNVMVDRSGTVKICDFGIAKAASNLFNETATGFTKGTPRYMSPDQLEGLKPLRPCSDVFSLAVVLYELITARPLFRGDSVPSLTHQIVFGDITGKLAEVEQAFPGCGPLLERALERDHTKRIQSAGELAEGFRALGRRYPSEAELSTVIARLARAVERDDEQEIRHSGDIDFDLSDARGVAAKLAELEQPEPDSEDTPIPVPGANSSGWARFTDVFPSGVTATHAAAPQPTDLPAPAPVDTLNPTVKWGPEHGNPYVEQTEGADAASGGGLRGLNIVLGVLALFTLGVIVVLVVVILWMIGQQGKPVAEPSDPTPGPDVAGIVEGETGDAGAQDEPVTDAEEPVTEAEDPTQDELATEASQAYVQTVQTKQADEPETSAPPAAATGELSFFVKPWAQVYLDGSFLGGLQRPGKPITVDGGAHTLKLVCDHDQCPADHPEKQFDLWIDGATMTVDGVAVTSGKNWLCWDFAENARCD